jgi:hypothetical protein
VKFFAEVLTKDMDKPGVKNLEIIDSENGWAVKSRIPIQGFKFPMMINTDVNQQSRSFRTMEIPNPERKPPKNRIWSDNFFPRGHEPAVRSRPLGAV